MKTEKTPKEIAFLREHFLNDWNAPFADLVKSKIEFPREGKMLLVEAGTGSFALEIRERTDEENLEIYCTETQDEAAEILQAKIDTARPKNFFVKTVAATDLEFNDDEFDLTIFDASFYWQNDNFADALREARRVTKTGAKMIFLLPTTGSFGEFFSILWETLYNLGETEKGAEVENLITEQLQVSQAEDLAKEIGLKNVESHTKKENFDFPNAEDFASAPLVEFFLMPHWTKFADEDLSAKLNAEIQKTIKDTSDGISFRLSLKAALIAGTK